MSRQKTFFISTSIPYVNAAPHLGHALEFVQADIIARHRRALGEDVFFLSGTDDNALKNAQAAEVAGVPVREFVDQNAVLFKNLLESLEVSTDDFIRTANDARHKEGAQKLWSACKSDDIELRKYRGLYCVGCEEFKTEKDLVNGECPEHPGKKLEEVEEENYFFKLSNYQERLERIVASGELQIVPEIRKNETLAFIRSGLQDFSISRSKERARGWGIPVPGHEGQMMYVWFDALSNYINALGYGAGGEKYKKYWEEGDARVHAIGKGINRFHSIYWPAMLLSAGVPLPTKLFIHGYITVGGQKMSKTLGNVIAPEFLIDEYGAEAVRFFLAKHVSSFEDSDMTLERFEGAYNADLANGLGNLVSRIMKMAESNNVTTLLPPEGRRKDSALFQSTSGDLMEFNINGAINNVWQKISRIDQKIQEGKPFEVVKNDPVSGKAIIQGLVQDLYEVAQVLEIFLPETAGKIQSCIKENKMPQNPLFPRKV